jgi:sporulation protein YlmC with PRC-barrel domain
MKALQDVQTWRGMTLVDKDGDKVGTIDTIYLDRQTGEPEWLTIKTGLIGLRSNFVPIRGAEETGDGTIRVPYDKKQIKDAPSVDDDGELSEEEERRLYEHYGFTDYDAWQGEDRTTALDMPDTARGRFERSGDAPAVVGVRLRRVVVVAAPDDRDRT